MKRTLLWSALAIGLALVPRSPAAAAPALPALGTELCNDPTVEARNIASEFELFGYQNPDICDQICKLRLNKCIALVKLDLRCMIEVDKTEYGYEQTGCSLLEDKQDAKDCSNSAKTDLSNWSDIEDELTQEGLDDCNGYYETCLSDCENPPPA